MSEESPEQALFRAGDEWRESIAEFHSVLIEVEHFRPQDQEEFKRWQLKMDQLADTAERLAAAIRRQNQALRELEG